MSDFDTDLEYRTGLLESLIYKLMSRADDTDRETQAVLVASTKIFEIVAKYQAPDEEFMDVLTIEEIEMDMVRLLTLSMNTGIASAKALAASKHFVSLGKKKGADAILQERSAIQAQEGKFVASAAKPLEDKEKGSYGIKSAKIEAEGNALALITDISDKLTQVLKRIHERKVREKTLAPGT